MIQPVFAHGGATLVLGEALATLRDLPPATADVVVADPPYSSGGLFRADRNQPARDKYLTPSLRPPRPEFAGDNRDQRAYLTWSTLWLSEALRVARPGAVLLLFSDWRQLPTASDAVQAGGWVWRGLVPWDKTAGARGQPGRYRSQCEYVLWATAGPYHRPRAAPLPGLFRYPVRQADKHHGAGKPTELLHDLLEIAPPGGLVLDPFAGSGTAGVAALQRRLTYLGIEITADYCEIAATRLLAAAAGAQVVPAGHAGPVERARARGQTEMDWGDGCGVLCAGEDAE